jgi:RNA polymerase sigma-70 factor, ECF subfamily
MSQNSEQELLKGARVFDPGALAAIYDLYSPGLFNYSMRLLGDEHLAKDCVAETFSRLLRALRDGKGPETFLKAYLYRVAHNWVTDIYRRQPPPPLELDENLAADEWNKPEKLVDEQAEREQLRAALRRLSDDQRQVVTLKFIEGWENDEIAEALQKPAGTVRVLQSRGLEILRKLLLQGEEIAAYELER